MRELGVERIEVHVAGVCVRTFPDGQVRVLALHRTDQRTLFPDYWEGFGGQVRPGETFEAAVTRHLSDEAALRGRVIGPVCTYVIEPNSTSGSPYVIPGIRFLVEYLEGEPSLDPRQHGEYRWIPEEDLPELSWIPGLEEQIQEALGVYNDDRP